MITSRFGRSAAAELGRLPGSESWRRDSARQKTLIAVARDKDKQKRSRKDAQLVLRLEKDLRERFIDACQDLDTSAAREVRRFIRRFLRRYEKGELHD